MCLEEWHFSIFITGKSRLKVASCIPTKHLTLKFRVQKQVGLGERIEIPVLRRTAMAAETGGIALLSMYGDDEEEEEPAASAEDNDGEDDGEIPKNINDENDHPPETVHDKTPLPLTSPSPLRSLDCADSKTLMSPFPQRIPTPQPPASRSQLSSPLSFTSPSPPFPGPVPPSSIQEHLDGQRARRAGLAIVDYAHDETAMSPETGGMDIASDGHAVYGAELHVFDGNIEGANPAASQTVALSSQQEPIHSFDEHEQSKSDASMAQEFTRTEIEVAEVKASSTVSTDLQLDEPLQNFLPPPVTIKCPEDLQEKINKFLSYKRAGKSFNADLRNRKNYRNPNFLQHAVSYQDIDEIGTCFSKEVFDPHGYDKSDYYEEIEGDMKRELEKKDQERKKSQKIDFVSGCTQSGGVPPALKMNAHVPGVSAPLNSALQPNSTTADVGKDSRTNKKSKWDKVDGDAKNSLPSGCHDNLPNTSVHAAHLSAANAGTGYSAFAQQKRKEAEERRSSERKFDKRS